MATFQSDESEFRTFSRALLVSERRRTLTLIALYAIVLGFAGVRETVRGWTPELLGTFALTLVLGVGHEILVLRRIGQAMKSGEDVPSWIWVINVIVECSIPTVFLASMVLTDDAQAPAYLSYPTIHAYYIFIALAILHLQPALCLLAAVVSAAEYGAVAALVLLGDQPTEAVPLPTSIYVTYTVIMISVGIGAAAVAREIRRHVMRALDESEARGRMERDLDIARSIQTGLMPTEPLELGLVQVAGRSDPADHTGGDYFDWQHLPEDRLAVTLADVTGHGIGPALVASVCRAYARATALQNHEPRKLTEAVNELLVDDLPDDRFVTFVMGVVDAQSGAVDLVAAGHGPIMHLEAATGDIEEHGAQAMPLGILPGVDFEASRRIMLDSGDALLFVTDGMFEQCSDAGEPYGLERLRESLRRSSGLSAADVIAALFADYASFVGEAVQKDDVTAVVIRRT